MKVPRINIGVQVIVPEAAKKYEGAVVISRVDHIRGRFAVRLSNISDNTHEKVEQLIGPNWTPLSEYDPLPNMNNFLRAIKEWDYHYRASDDSRIYEEGKEYEAALIELFRRLRQEDQFNCRKIVEIVVMSTTPK